MYRTKTCGELRISNVGETVTLAGWVQSVHNLGALTFVDLRDRYGITQLAFNEDAAEDLRQKAGKLGREFVIQATGVVAERYSKNKNIPTGDIEIIVSELNILNTSDVPPFTIEDESDGGDDIRMKYRYLDLRRSCVRKNLELRHKFAFEVRRYLDQQGFLEIETPILVNSTPEGARDFVVPSRMNPGQFYALPQSPLLLGCKALDTLYHHAAVPRAVKDSQMSVLGESLPETPQIMMCLLNIVWRCSRHNLVTSRIYSLCDSLDSATLAAGIPAFKSEHHRNALKIHLVMKYGKSALQILFLFLVLLVSDRFAQIYTGQDTVFKVIMLYSRLTVLHSVLSDDSCNS